MSAFNLAPRLLRRSRSQHNKAKILEDDLPFKEDDLPFRTGQLNEIFATKQSIRESQTHMKTTVDLPIAVTATDRASMERELGEAVAAAMTPAMREGRRGILVTRHDSSSFTVDLSDAVPFGLTCEHREW